MRPAAALARAQLEGLRGYARASKPGVLVLPYARCAPGHWRRRWCQQQKYWHITTGSTWQRRACAVEAFLRTLLGPHLARGAALARSARSCRPLEASFLFVRQVWSAKTVCVFVCHSCAAVSMKADGFQLPAGVKKALAPAVAVLSIAAPAFAEGTGEVSRGLHGPCERCARLWLAKGTPACESCHCKLMTRRRGGSCQV